MKQFGLRQVEQYGIVTAFGAWPTWLLAEHRRSQNIKGNSIRLGAQDFHPIAATLVFCHKVAQVLTYAKQCQAFPGNRGAARIPCFSMHSDPWFYTR